MIEFNALLFSSILEDYRLKNKITYDDMVAELKMSKQTINKLINYKTTPSMTTFLTLCNYMHQDAGQFFTKLKTDSSSKKEESELEETSGIDYMVDRFEELVAENATMKLKLQEYESNSSVAAESKPKYKRKNKW